MHIYDCRFPVAPNATLRPPDAHVDAYRLLRRGIVNTRTVVVKPSTYGTDSSCTLDALAQMGTDARGVAVVNASVSDAELARLAGRGNQGIRFNLVQAGATTVEMLTPLADRVNELGWHVQLHKLADHIVNIEDTLQSLPSPIVFDHIGRMPQPPGIDHPAFALILRLIEKGRAWVKISGAYLNTKIGAPTYSDASAIARATGLGQRLAAPYREREKAG